MLCPDPTRITQGPVDMEIMVGESLVLPCQVASDPVLDVTFSWAFNGQLIAKGDRHFEPVGGVSDSRSVWEEKQDVVSGSEQRPPPCGEEQLPYVSIPLSP